MAAIHDIDAVVLDVLGTLVDEPGGLRSAIREAVPASDEATVEDLLGLWLRHGEREQRRIGRGRRPYVPTETLDAEAARMVADRADVTDPATVTRLATAGQRLSPWADSVAGVEQLARQLPVFGLSNAGRTTLLRLGARAGLRWHRALSGETVRAYKPAPEVYRLAIDAAGCPPERVLMVAAHAWDLRGARAVGMRTAYVHRPAGDPPTGRDRFDGHFDGMGGLVAALTRG
ncbi:haloacid dehalogenase type II [Streptomyces griseorubiginosus]|uniref:haloacid dehalogenase type II n=1 Tax=Streptomyces griseorubiginosus TaxID=67304 RepID=UPI0033AD80E4